MAIGEHGDGKYGDGRTWGYEKKGMGEHEVMRKWSGRTWGCKNKGMGEYGGWENMGM